MSLLSCLQSGFVNEVPWLVEVRLEEEVDESELIDRHPRLDTHTHRVDGLRYLRF